MQHNKEQRQTQLLKILAKGCRKHPAYRAIRKATERCEECVVIWQARVELNALEKKTTFDNELFKKAQSEGKVVVVSSWMKYCSSCVSQMKVLNKIKNDFENIEYLTFEITNQ